MEQDARIDDTPDNDTSRGSTPAPGDPANSEVLSPHSRGPFVSLDRRVIQLWRISGLIGFAIVALPALVGLLLASHAFLGQPLFAFVPWTLLLLLAGIWIIWYPSRAYQTWGYRVEEQVLEIRSGVWFRVVRLLPLSRLQHVDLHRGPLERAHGLASLTLHTAGTREASLGIPGLADADAERLRDQLAAAGGDDAV